MNTQPALKEWRVVVSVEENEKGNTTPCGTKSVTPSKILIAKLENSDQEVGRAWLSMPKSERGDGAQGCLVLGKVETMAPDMEIVKLVLMAKAQELLPKNPIVVSYDGEMPQGVKAERYAKDTYILNPRAAFT